MAMENAAGGDRQGGAIMEMCGLCKNWISKTVPTAKGSGLPWGLRQQCWDCKCLICFLYQVTSTERRERKRKRNKAIGHCLSHLLREGALRSCRPLWDQSLGEGFAGAIVKLLDLLADQTQVDSTTK